MMTTFSCWVCGSKNGKLVKPSSLPENMDSSAFAITDSNYGSTSELSQCLSCGFIQSTGMSDVLAFYEKLEDQHYEDNRTERSLQAAKILAGLRKLIPAGRLLDVGAGSGMLVQQARVMGFQAEGIEPSVWLQSVAQKLDLHVVVGTLPHPGIQGPYDVVTLIDVIEHVPDPVGLLKEIHKVLKPGSYAVVVTPDVSSLAAKILRFKWWHFRIAHIGYFNKQTLTKAAERAGFTPIQWSRPSWFFQGDYLYNRVMKYLPKWLRIPAPKFLQNITVPLNLRDSMQVVLRKV